MGNNPSEEVMLQDLNQEPLDQAQDFMLSLELVTINNQLESTRNQFEPETPSLGHSVDRVSARRTTVSSSKKCPENNLAFLVSRALETESFRSNDPCYNGGSGEFYDCNVCLKTATYPVLTCCGHLFCWPCFYNLRYERLNVKECTVCGGDVEDTSVLPIYGNGDCNPSPKRKKTLSLDVPPRPKAKRLEIIESEEHQRRVITARIELRIRQLTDIVTRMGNRGRAAEPPQNNDARTSSSAVLERPPGSPSFLYVSSALDMPEIALEHELVFGAIHTDNENPFEEVGSLNFDLLSPVSPRWLEMGAGFESSRPPRSPEDPSIHDDDGVGR